MKKTFSLHRVGLDDARVLESVRLEIRKYVKRERRKKVPEGFVEWSFSCRVGATADTAVTRELEEVIPAVEVFAAGGAPAVYVEILAAPATRPNAAAGDPSPGTGVDAVP